MTYSEAKATTDFTQLVTSIDEDQFYGLVLESNKAGDFEFSAQVMKAQSDARRSSLIDY
ncbi:hypothetical protein VPHD479_0316 [Vibrio phage D479]